MSSIPENIIIKFLQNTASQNEIHIFNQWISENERNREMFYELMEIWDTGREGLSREELSRSWNKLNSKITKTAAIDQTPFRENIAIKPMPRAKQRILQWTRYAAAILIGVVLSASWYYLNSGNNKKEQTVQNTIYNRNGVMKQVLPDSSVVWLYANSSISYPGHFDSQLRKVSVQGEAFFDVRKNKTCPFVVQAGHVDIRVLGTEFVVKSVTGTDISVTLISGSVSVNANDSTGEMMAHARLEPGQQADISRMSGQIRVLETDTQYYVAWKDGTYRFKDEPLEKVIGLLSRYFHLDIKMSPELKNMRFTGTVTPENDISEVMDILQITHPIEYQVTKAGVTIKLK